MQKKIDISSSEEIISMFLGLVIVLVIISLIFNFFKKQINLGTVNAPGDNKTINVVSDMENGKIEKVYVVKKGDNLWKIAVDNYGDGNKWTVIAKENNLKNPSVLLNNQELIIPKIDTEIVNNEQKNVIEESEYIIKNGDNLWKISVDKYNDGYQWTKVWEKNKNIIKSPSVLYTGTKIILPKYTKTMNVLN